MKRKNLKYHCKKYHRDSLEKLYLEKQLDILGHYEPGIPIARAIFPNIISMAVLLLIQLPRLILRPV